MLIVPRRATRPRAFRLIASVAVIVAIGGLTNTSAASARQEVQEGDGLATLQTCWQKSSRLRAVLLVDTSRSLNDTKSRPGTDPEDLRVDALHAAVDAFASAVDDSVAGADTPPAHVELLLAGFGEDFEPVGGWRELGGGRSPELDSDIEGFRSKDDSADTDYLHAFVGAKAALDERSHDQSSVGEACSLIVVFSDGAYSIDPHPGTTKDYAPDIDLGSRPGRAAAVRRGVDQLCRVGGVMDQLRSSSTVTLALGLRLGSARPPAEFADVAPLDFFSSVAVGRHGSYDCGEPQSSAWGRVVSVDDIRGMITTTVCFMRPQPCIGSGPIGVDRSISHAFVEASAAVRGMRFQLTAPDGASADVPLDTEAPVVLGAASITSHSRSEFTARLVIEFDQSQDSQVGQWLVTPLDGSGMKLPEKEVSLAQGVTSNLALQLVDAGDWRVGEAADVSAQLTVGDPPLPVGPGELEPGLVASGVVSGASSAGTPIPVDVSQADTSGLIHLRIGAVPEIPEASVNVRAQVDGPLPGSTAERPLVRPPAVVTLTRPLRRGGNPFLVDVPVTGIRLSGIEGDGEKSAAATGSVKVSADRYSEGRACLERLGDLELPDGTERVRLRKSDCIDIPKGETRELPIAVDVGTISNGPIKGRLMVRLSSPTEPKAAVVDVDLGFASYTPICQQVLWLTVGVVLFGALLLALVVIYVVSRLSKPFPSDPGSIQWVRRDVVVRGGRVVDADRADAAPVEFDVAEFKKFLGVERAGRTLALEGATISSRPHIFGLSDALFEFDDRTVIGSHDGLGAGRLRRSGAIEPSLSGGWAIAVTSCSAAETDTDEPVLTGTMFVLLDSEPGNRARLGAMHRKLQSGTTVRSLRRATDLLVNRRDPLLRRVGSAIVALPLRGIRALGGRFRRSDDDDRPTIPPIQPPRL